MNITDFKGLKLPKGDMLFNMFERQKELMAKYHDIESKLRLCHDNPVDLNDPAGQLLLKDFAWRCTEEVAEAMTALFNVMENDNTADDPHYMLHCQEEIADAFHFLLEFALLSGWDREFFFEELDDERGFGDYLIYLYGGNQFRTGQYIIGNEALEFIRQLGMVCHTLKNKPWKQSHMVTDEKEFYFRLTEAIKQFLKLCAAMDMGPDELYLMYFHKSEVNKFRQRSNY